MNNMMEQLIQMQQKIEQSKQKLENITCEGEAPGGKVRIVINGNRMIKNIYLSDEFSSMEKEELEDLLIIAFNNAIESATKINEQEMQSAAMGILPGLK